MLPLDPDALGPGAASAACARLTGAAPAVVITDSFGRAWRHGQCDVAIGVCRAWHRSRTGADAATPRAASCARPGSRWPTSWPRAADRGPPQGRTSAAGGPGPRRRSPCQHRRWARGAGPASTRSRGSVPVAGRRTELIAVQVGSAPNPRARPQVEQHERADGQVPAARAGHPHALDQPAARPPRRAAAAAAPGHAAAGRPRRPDPDLPDGPDHAGGLARAGDRDPRGGARGLQAVAPDAAVTAPGGSSASSTPRRTSTTSTRASRPPARTSPTPPSRRPTRTRRPGSAVLPPRPAPASGARRWPSPARCSDSSARCSWSARATTRSPTGAR